LRDRIISLNLAILRFQYLLTGTTPVKSPIRLIGYDQEIIPEMREIRRPEHWLPG
jgi:hypothetical protein